MLAGQLRFCSVAVLQSCGKTVHMLIRLRDTFALRARFPCIAETRLSRMSLKIAALFHQEWLAKIL